MSIKNQICVRWNRDSDKSFIQYFKIRHNIIFDYPEYIPPIKPKFNLIGIGTSVPNFPC
jgi:hypothetical protein